VAPHPQPVPRFDLPGALRRIRRLADLSQRDLALALGVSKSSVGGAEAGTSGMDARILDRAAEVAGLRLALVDEAGDEVSPMAPDAVRDGANRRFPAHLDTRFGDEDWWHGLERYSRLQPWYTFDRLRHTRDQWRSRAGTPEDHHLPQPGDSPSERRAARQRAARLRNEEDRRRRLASGTARTDQDWGCSCPPGCDELDDRSGPPVHEQDCPCSCDVA
jgi:transcriptional regulator with XRE-family HTH domain